MYDFKPFQGDFSHVWIGQTGEAEDSPPRSRFILQRKTEIQKTGNVSHDYSVVYDCDGIVFVQPLLKTGEINAEWY